MPTCTLAGGHFCSCASERESNKTMKANFFLTYHPPQNSSPSIYLPIFLHIYVNQHQIGVGRRFFAGFFGCVNSGQFIRNVAGIDYMLHLETCECKYL